MTMLSPQQLHWLNEVNSAAEPTGVRSTRILMTLDAVGGVWRYGIDLAEGLRMRGFDTIFACLGPEPNEAQAAEAERCGELVHLGGKLDWQVDSEAELGRIYDLISNAAARCGADLLHLNLPSQAASLEADAPIVTVSHSCVPTWFHAMRDGLPERLEWNRKLNTAGFRASDAVIAPSASHAAMLLDCYGSIENLRVVHNSVASCGEACHKDHLVFAAARWWDEAKNGKVLDEAADSMDWPLLLAGSCRGPGGETVTIDSAICRGQLSHAETLALMRQAAIVVSPSLYEPFGLVALEAAASGAALVLADIPTYRELWDGAACFADPHDPDAFAATVNLLVSSGGLREKFAEAARDRSKLFSRRMQVDAMAALYRQLIQTAQSANTEEI
jgi:glycosyltransferase involved in cell wall biosynthesis